MGKEIDKFFTGTINLMYYGPVLTSKEINKLCTNLLQQSKIRSNYEQKRTKSTTK